MPTPKSTQNPVPAAEPSTAEAAVSCKIEHLTAAGDLGEAYRQFDAFWQACDLKRREMIHNQSRFAELERQRVARTITNSEADILRNQVIMSCQMLMDDFRRDALSKYFAVEDRKSVLENINSRDAVIEEILSLRLTSKRYKLEKFMEEGNSAIIYRLLNVDTNRHAIAMVFKTPQIWPELKREVERLTDLRHRNIIKPSDYHLSSFPYFVVTEYIYGETIPKAINSVGPRPVSQAVDWLYQLTDALDYLRHKNILHTNVRPSKIFIDDEWQVMISPFDLNRVGAGEVSPEQLQQRRSNERTLNRYRDVCQYGSPELLEEDGAELSLQAMCLSDQYSLGLIGYKLLIGADIFAGESIRDILRSRDNFVKNGDYRADKLAALPDDEIGQIIRRLLSEKASERYPTLHATLRALHPFTRLDSPQVSIARQSYRRCLANNKDLIRSFYHLFYQKAPHTEAAFSQLGRKRQSAMLQMALDVIIDLEHKSNYFSGIVGSAKHAPFQFADFEIFLDALLETIERNDPQWPTDPNIALEWQALRDNALQQIRKMKP